MRSTALTSVLMMTIALAPANTAGRSVGRELGDAGSWMGRTVGRLASARDAGVTLASWAAVQSAAQPEHILPLPPWADDDPADSLYRAARAALSDGDYKRAADLFGRISDGYPRSTYARVALYYQAFALYRSGNGADLHNALGALHQLSALDPTDRGHGDAASLRTRICTALARQGAASCAERIVQQAESAAAPCSSDDDDNDVRIAAGSVAPVPLRLSETEGVVKGNTIDSALIQHAKKAAAGEIRPIDDIRSTAAYRSAVLGNLVMEFLQKLATGGQSA